MEGLFLPGAWFSNWYVVSIDTGHIAQSPQSGPRWNPAFKIKPVLFSPSDDAIQPSHPLLSPSPPAFNLSYHQDLFQWVSSSHQVAKVGFIFSSPLLVLKEETEEQAPSWKQDSILGRTVDFELYAQYLWKWHTNWKTRPPEWKSPRAHT